MSPCHLGNCGLDHTALSEEILPPSERATSPRFSGFVLIPSIGPEVADLLFTYLCPSASSSPITSQLWVPIRRPITTANSFRRMSLLSDAKLLRPQSSR